MHIQFNTFLETHFRHLLDTKFWATFIRSIQLQFGFFWRSELYKHVMDILGMNGVGHSQNSCLSVLDLLITISIIRIMSVILGRFLSSGTVSLEQMLSMSSLNLRLENYDFVVLNVYFDVTLIKVKWINYLFKILEYKTYGFGREIISFK